VEANNSFFFQLKNFVIFVKTVVAYGHQLYEMIFPIQVRKGVENTIRKIVKDISTVVDLIRNLSVSIKS